MSRYVDHDLCASRSDLTAVVDRLRIQRRCGDRLITQIHLVRRSRADRLPAALAGADSDAVFKRKDEDFAVADLPGLRSRRVNDGFNRRLDESLLHGRL